MKQMKKIIVLLAIIAMQNIKAQQSNSIYNAARNGEVEIVKKMLAQSPKLLNKKTQMGFTPLILSVYNNQLATTKYLIDAGADINAFDRSGNTAFYNKATALTFVATFGTPELAKILVDAGADPKIRDNQGKNAIDHARFHGNEAILKVLIEE